MAIPQQTTIRIEGNGAPGAFVVSRKATCWFPKSELAFLVCGKLLIAELPIWLAEAKDIG